MRVSPRVTDRVINASIKRMLEAASDTTRARRLARDAELRLACCVQNYRLALLKAQSLIKWGRE